MTMEMIPFQVEAKRVISLLANQIYQSPLALLRENAQNAYDAILMRHQRDTFEGRIDIQLQPHRIVVNDNGIGMTPDQVKDNYWRAGSSGKNTEEAINAGVVGTFGIGAMANFGIANRLVMETEARGHERCRTSASIADLSLHEDCVRLEKLPSTGRSGTTVTATIPAANHIDVESATKYIADFVCLSSAAIYVNGRLVSQLSADALVEMPARAWVLEEQGIRIGHDLEADLSMVISQNADVRVALTNIRWHGERLVGIATLRSGQAAIRTFRSGFGLATVTVPSVYQFGGVVDLQRVLQPTAGREALTVESTRFLQKIVSELEGYVSIVFAGRPECNASTPFMSWAARHGRIDLCGKLRMNIEPGGSIRLEDVRGQPDLKRYYGGSDTSVVTKFTTEESPVLILARNDPRRACELAYLRQFCEVEEISDHPVVERPKGNNELSSAEHALSYRLQDVLERDYFVSAVVAFGSISHGLPMLVEKVDDRILVTLDPGGQTVSLMLSLYDGEYTAFGSMVKDFARSAIFPHIRDFVPSSSRQGAEAFLRAIRKPRETFEYEETDLDSLPQVWKDYEEGRISMTQAVRKSVVAVRTGIQVVDSESAVRFDGVAPDVLRNERDIQAALKQDDSSSLDARPSITRTEIRSDAKLLTIGDEQPALRGYRCFLALTQKIRTEVGDFFLQPHRTTVVWGGQRVLFVFLDHSETFGVYYDLQANELLSAESGGGAFPTCTIMLRNGVYIPVPDLIRPNFVPEPGERKRFEVRQDILRVSD